MNTQIRPETRAAYKVFFEKCDHDKDGFLDYSELEYLFKKIYAEPPADFNLKDTFAKFDKDGNNKIDFQEVLTMVPELPSIEDLFRQAFKSQDVNEDQVLTKRELQFALSTLGHYVRGTAAQKLIDIVDADKDGKMNIEEMLKLIPMLYAEDA